METGIIRRIISISRKSSDECEVGLKYINQHKAAIITIATVSGFYLILFSQGITCPIKYVTGISCACCGMTRAWISLAGGDLQRAFSYHPLVLAPLLLIPMFFYRKKMPENYHKVMIAAVCAVFLIVYVIRMADPDDLIVTFDPKGGIIWRTLDLISESCLGIGTYISYF